MQTAEQDAGSGFTTPSRGERFQSSASAGNTQHDSPGEPLRHMSLGWLGLEHLLSFFSYKL